MLLKKYISFNNGAEAERGKMSVSRNKWSGKKDKMSEL